MTGSNHPARGNGFNKFLLYTLSIILIVIIGTILILSSVPPVSRDALTHHLFIPKLYLQHGGIYEIPEIVFSYYPMNLDLLYLIPLYLGNDIVPKYIHFSFALFTSYCIFKYLKTRIGTEWGLWGALFFLTIPIIIKLSITVYVDLGLVFFSTAAVLSLIGWLNKNFMLRYLILSGLCAGMAAGTKYNGLVTIIILVLFVPFFYSRCAPPSKKNSEINLAIKSIGFGLVFLASVAITYGPWLVRNYQWTGNPIYPLHNNFFIKDKISTTAQETVTTKSDQEEKNSVSNGNIFIARRIVYGESVWETILLPIRFFIEGQDDNPRYFDGKLNPFLLILPLCALIRTRDNPQFKNYKVEISILFSFALLYFFFTFFQSAMRVRYITPSLPPLTILSALGACNIYYYLKERIGKSSMVRVLTVLLLSIALAPNINYLNYQFKVVSPFSYLSGKTGRSTYITKYRPEYTAINWLNKRTDREDIVLSIFLGNRGYYMDFFPIFINPFVTKLPRSHQTARYALVRIDLFMDWYQYAIAYNLEPELPFDLDKPVYAADGYAVFEIMGNYIETPIKD